MDYREDALNNERPPDDASTEPAHVQRHGERLELLEALEAATTSLVWSSDRTNTLDYVNARWVEYTGLTLDEILRSGRPAVNHPDDVARVFEIWQHTLETGQPSEAEYRYRRHDGEYRWFLGRIVPVLDAHGAVTRCVCTMTDIHHRKLAERQLQETLGSVTDSVLTLDANWCVIYLNAAAVAEDPQRRAHEELLGKPMWDLYPELIDKPFYIAAHKAMREQKTAQSEFWYEPTDQWFDIQLYPAPSSLTLLYRNVTDRKRQEEALRESEERFRATFEQAAVGMAHVGLNGRWMRVNQRLCGIVGYSREELLRLTFQDITYPDDLKADLAQAARLQAGEITSYSMEKRYIRKNGTVIWINLTGSMVRDAEGKPLYFISVIEDISGRKRVEQERQEALALLDTLVRGVPVGFAFIDNTLRYRLVNDALAAINGLPADLHLGRTVGEIVPDLAGQVEDAFRRVMETGTPIVNQEVVGETALAPGVRRHWLESWYPVRGSKGEYLGTGVIILEVTEMRRAQMQIDDLNKRLHRAVVESSHRIKNHLQLLAATADLAVMETPDSVPGERVRRLGTQARMLAQIHDVLTAETKDDAHVQVVSAQTLLSKVAEVIPLGPSGRHLQLHVEDALVAVRMASSLALAVNELVSNSLKHGAGDIEVAFLVDGNRCALRVSDSGPGFPEGFNPASAANTGLELIDSIARIDLSGAVRFENRPQGGAQVTVSFALPTLGPTSPLPAP